MSDRERFRSAVTALFGLRFDDAGGLLDEVLQRRASATGVTVPVYLQRLQAPAPDELRALARELTVGETYFFRNHEQFAAFAEVALPERMSARRESRQLTIISAGCASGEEAYSLAMAVDDQKLDPSWRVSVCGVDLNPAALDKARAGHYSTWSLREAPADLRERRFTSAGRDLVLDPAIRDAVRFREGNLTHDDPAVWQPDADVIFCRNVLMYFTPEQAQAVVAHIWRALAPGGFLFLGHAETLRGLSPDFHLRHTHDTFYYQRKDRTRASEPVASVRAWEPPLPEPSGTASWIETIQHSSDRIRALSEETATPPPTAMPVTRGPELGAALGLLREERYAEALDQVRALPADPEVLLLRAVLLTHGGELVPAERTCRELLVLDELSAGAHYLLALCREAAGDAKGAIDHDQRAIYLEPAFAMPRLHLGLMARRAGDLERARRELEQALHLLGGEDSSRVLLYGGGFNREALSQMCRVELARATGDRR